ncbi:MAG: tRNA (N(6)-L-threonylcarbamoyladenosine(37)-C(2))-methylthiotransferase MtaB [Actinomycetota bacterium]|nr:tRNA (N(6)-L-threonylcarbamoyladenosine(37)-C(2))-methylthiotransferase MtaB [Actinomycetota bacterium]
MRVAFSTLGCRLNQAETDSMSEQLEAVGIERVARAEDAGVVVVNTCTVTREATKASRMAIRRAVAANPGSRVVVIGCYAVSDPDEIRTIDGVDLVLGNDAKDSLPEALGLTAPPKPLMQIGIRRDGVGGQRKVRANLKVQTGCDEWCTFCIIPTTRGPLKSTNEDDLVAEARARAAAGARELVLTGVHLGKYTFDTGGDERSLVRLFGRLLDIDGVLRLRLSSIFARHLTREVLDFMASEERMCRYLHVPLQSGDPKVLADMHRSYEIGEYVEHVERAVDALPGVALATDLIVGFPTETDEAFEGTMEVVQRLRFSKLHVFRYSPRPGTAAAGMADSVPPAVKKERSKRLIDLGNAIRNDFLNAHLGVPLEVLVEDERGVEPAAGSAGAPNECVTVSSGQTSDYVRVWFEGGGMLGSLVDVRGTGIRSDGIRGELIDRSARRSAKEEIDRSARRSAKEET